MAQAVRAILLASAMAATLVERRAIGATSQGLRVPPVEFCFGTSPIQADRSRPERKAWGSGMEATNAVAISGPTPGISASRRLIPNLDDNDPVGSPLGRVG